MNKAQLRNLCINGYIWFGLDKGIHLLLKQVSSSQWLEIRCTESQLSNGDIEFMATHNLTLAP